MGALGDPQGVCPPPLTQVRETTYVIRALPGLEGLCLVRGAMVLLLWLLRTTVLPTGWVTLA